MLVRPCTDKMAELRGVLDYCGSETEKLMKNWIGKLVTEASVPECFNLVIKHKACNGMMPGPFNNACVVLRLHADMMKPAEDREHIIALSFDQVFNLEVLKTISKEEFILSNLKLSSPLASVLLPLLDYLNDIERHENTIRKFMDNLSDGSILTAVLAEHLFARLVPGHDYVLDNRCKTLPKECPCAECKAPLVTGCTALGSSTTWHGYTDIFVNDCVAVSMYRQGSEDNSDSEANSEKELPEYIDDQDSRLCMEVKGHQQHSEVLYELNVMHQLLAKTITNGFAQVNASNSLTGCLIPTFGCTAEALCVYLYDPVNDILLQTCQLIKLWQNDGKFNIAAIIKIWLYLNFTTLCVCDITKMYGLLKSGFHTCEGDVLKRYQKIKCKFAIGPPEDKFEHMMESLLEMCQRATPRNPESIRLPNMA